MLIVRKTHIQNITGHRIAVTINDWIHIRVEKYRVEKYRCICQLEATRVISDIMYFVQNRDPSK